MYWIKTYGAKLSDLTFYRYPTVIENARHAVTDSDVVGYLLCAVESLPKITGLLFYDPARKHPDGLPLHALPVVERSHRSGYDVFTTIDGGALVVAHWWHENGALDRLDLVH
ncbi:hypothetical protein DLD99_05925 [Pseudomonas kribbensis]|uniref:Uncharacterized protein n=1 Tax=Pseudomonas kribbensis TaxID=1628086 RepID=A0A345RL59_9PSED|nr:hypothetical protein [Pseudomonas kribbensis]AXI60025.1 hypothetical protein DLD99_05925 [Pseudomonas kribbensis]